MSYTKEIECLCKNGYKVFTFDYPGCFESEGENCISMSEPLCAGINALNALNDVLDYNGLDIYVMGHSWGGYVAGNLLNFRDDIKKCVVISGFVSVPILLNQIKNYSSENYGSANLINDDVIAYEKLQNPQYYESSSLDAYNNCRGNSIGEAVGDNASVDIMIIHSKDDSKISFEDNLNYIMQNTSNKNIKYVIYDDKKHNPYYKKEAIEYLLDKLGGFNKLVIENKLVSFDEKKSYCDSIDWDRATEQDDDFWDNIIKFLNG